MYGRVVYLPTYSSTRALFRSFSHLPRNEENAQNDYGRKKNVRHEWMNSSEEQK